MSFLTLSTGQNPSGDAEKAHFGTFKLIPNDSKYLARILKFEKQAGLVQFYRITWEIVQGPYEGQTIRQSLFVFSDNASASDRAKEMFVRIYKLAGILPPQLEPMAHELAALENKILGLKIQERTYTDRKTGESKETNDVSEVHHPKEFVESEGSKLTVATRNPYERIPNKPFSELNPPLIDDEIAF